ncbi:PAS domain S-box-containing protein [Chitinivorax tropicus]|uniref:PAS domain S-box-containing protein n=1 Tax=Chitinivorax tropicus TaxID=714531 RepID=A0A840MQ28_9PROT|nr:PAS domain S-box protein [Chitinivorax tropicus]MBB5018862.1 PAS domain S-box-containing protein [Chitinivorax tropicus]
MIHVTHDDWGDDPSASGMGEMIRLLESMLNGMELDLVLDGIVSLAERQAKGARCLISLADTPARRLRLSSSPHVPLELILELEDLPFGEEGGGFGLVAERGQVVAASDVEHDHSWRAVSDTLLAAGIHSVLAYPVLGQGKEVVAVVSLLFKDKHVSRSNEQILLRRVARLVHLAIRSDHKFRHLQESEQLYRTVVESLAVPAFILRGDRFCYVNPAMETLVGYTATEMQDHVAWEWIESADRQQARADLIGVQRGEVNQVHHAYRFHTKQGEDVSVDLQIRPVRFHNAPAALAIGTV